MRIFLAMIVGDMTRFLLWLFDGGLDLLAVDVDGDPAGACLCHKLMFWQRWFKRPSQVGTVRGNAVVSFDSVFVFPNTATTIEVVSFSSEKI